MRKYSDAARRVADAANLHSHAVGFANASGKWIACKLADGESDGVLYDSKHDAIRSQKMDEKYYVYVNLQPTGMTYSQAETYLTFVRQMYDAGWRIKGVDGDRTPLLPSAKEKNPFGVPKRRRSFGR